MARSEARIRCAVWQDPEFTKLPRSAQGLYWMLLSQPDVTLAGVLPFMPGRWAMLADDDTADGDLAALEASRFVVVDRTTCEVLIRTFAKHDGVLRSEKTRAGMWSAWAGVFSPRIRARFVAQLDNEHVDEAIERGWVSQEALDALPDPSEQTEDGVSDGVSHDREDGVSDGASSRAGADSDTDSTSASDTVAPAKPSREQIFQTLIEVCSWDIKALTTSARGRANKAAKELDEIGATPEGIRARAQVHRSKWPDMSVTPTSIAANYAELGKTAAPPTAEESAAVRTYDPADAEARYLQLTDEARTA